jgi:hypothetical protein
LGVSGGVEDLQAGPQGQGEPAGIGIALIGGDITVGVPPRDGTGKGVLSGGHHIPKRGLERGEAALDL